MSSIRLPHVLPLALLLVIAGCSKEPQPVGTPQPTVGVLTGRVTDYATGQPIAGVLVSTIPPSQSVTTDVTGTYTMRDMAPGTYNVRATKQGYNDGTVAVSIAAGKGTTGDMSMRPGLSDNHPPAVPASPMPADNSNGTPQSVTLQWTSSDPDNDPITYDIYFGKANPPGTVIGAGQAGNTIAQSNLDSNTTYYWFVVAKDDKGGMTVGPVWRFKTRATTGNPNDGKGAGKALSYSSSGPFSEGYVSVPHTTDLHLSDGSFTVEAWVNTSGVSGNTDIWNVILNKSHSNTDLDYLLGIDGDGRFSFITRSLTNFLRSDVIAQFNRWYHVAGVQNVATGKVALYINGAIVMEVHLSGTSTSSDAPLFIGAREYYGQGTASDGFRGIIDEVRIWNVARTGEQIVAAKNSRLSGSEPGLVANFRFDEGTGRETRDVRGNFIGTFIGAPQWITSTAPIN